MARRWYPGRIETDRNRVGGCLERCPAAPLADRDDAPILGRRLLERVLCIEQPVPFVGDDGFYFGDRIGRYAQAGAHRIRMRLVGDDDLGIGLAGILVEQAAMKIDVERLIDDAVASVDQLHLLHEARPRRERHQTRITCRLRFDVGINGGLQLRTAAVDVGHRVGGKEQEADKGKDSHDAPLS